MAWRGSAACHRRAGPPLTADGQVRVDRPPDLFSRRHALRSVDAAQFPQLRYGVADDIRTLGHAVWLDQELSGGQSWWDQILEQVRACDVFVFALAPEFLFVLSGRSVLHATPLSRAALPSSRWTFCPPRSRPRGV